MAWRIPPWIYIILALLILSIGFLLTYTIGVIQGNFRAVLPYISNTGAYPIENGVFVMVTSLSCLFLLLVVYTRYRDAILNVDGLFFKIYNFIFYVVGVFAQFFLLCVAAFEQDDSDLSRNFHFASAGLAIFLQVLYLCGQVYIGIRLPPRYVWWKWVILAVQLIMSIAEVILTVYFLMSFLDPAYRFYSNNNNNVNNSFIENNATLLAYYNEGLRVDYTRAFVEWVIVFGAVAFYFTFFPDFIRIRFELIITRPSNEKLPEIANDGKAETKTTEM